MTATFTPMDDKDYYEIVKKVFILYQSLEEFSYLIWNKFGIDFNNLDELKEIRRQALHFDNAAELPF